jgi:hypothetical protein
VLSESRGTCNVSVAFYLSVFPNLIFPKYNTHSNVEGARVAQQYSAG